MSRPKCCRHVEGAPGNTCFRPDGVFSPSCPEEVCLSLDEYESLRLADLEGLYQEQAASRMNVSRQTFGRIIEAAHRKVADVIVNGKTLRIGGGQVSGKRERSARCPGCHGSLGIPECAAGSVCPHCRRKL